MAREAAAELVEVPVLGPDRERGGVGSDDRPALRRHELPIWRLGSLAGARPAPQERDLLDLLLVM